MQSHKYVCDDLVVVYIDFSNGETQTMCVLCLKHMHSTLGCTSNAISNGSFFLQFVCQVVTNTASRVLYVSQHYLDKL